MATFNGSPYIAEQLESIRSQTMTKWNLIVRDDGSSDNTKQIIKEYSEIDSRIKLMEDDLGRLGPAGNFNRLMEVAVDTETPYFAFADQDDVWNEEKLRIQLRLMDETEKRCGCDIPILIHSDLQVVDEKLKLINNSYARYQRMSHPDTDDLRTLLVQNVAVGTTIMINRPLLKTTVPVPPSAHMHDWWLVLCAAVFGLIIYSPDQLVSYRIHSLNVTFPVGFRRAVNPLNGPLSDRLYKMNKIFVASFRQARVLKERIKSFVDMFFYEKCRIVRCIDIISYYLSILELPWYIRPVQLMRGHVIRQNIVLTALFYYQCMRNDLIKEVVSEIPASVTQPLT